MAGPAAASARRVRRPAPRGRDQGVRRPSPPSTTSTSTSRAGRSSPCSGRRAAARPRRCGWSPGWRPRPPGRSRIGGQDITCAKPLPAAGQHRVPELRAVPAPRHLRERRLRAAPARRSRRRRSRSTRCSSSSSWTDLASASPAQLSGGQQQRVALARALINRPEVLLLDEPLGALDLKLRRPMQIELKRIQTEVGLTFVHVTHDQEEAMTMADTVAVMNRGRIEQMGAPAELYENPRTTFVANFLGQSNLDRGRRSSTARRRRRRSTCSGIEVSIPAERAPRARRRRAWSASGPRRCSSRERRARRAGRQRLAAAWSATSASSASARSTSSGCRGARSCTVFEQNTGRGRRSAPGDEVGLSWRPSTRSSSTAGRGRAEARTPPRWRSSVALATRRLAERGPTEAPPPVARPTAGAASGRATCCCSRAAVAALFFVVPFVSLLATSPQTTRRARSSAATR